MRATVNERFSRTVTLTPDDVSAFARQVGDHNPVHHDAEFAAGTRYKRLIASATQTTALLLGLIATHFSQRGATVGLDFTFKLRKAIFADETISLEWEVVEILEAPHLKGDVVVARGRIVNAAGETAVDAKARLLVAESL